MRSYLGTGNSRVKATKIHFDQVVRSFIKNNLPGFLFEKKDAEQVIFRKPLSKETDLNIVFDKHFQRWERVYEISIGINYKNYCEPIPPGLLIRRIDFKENLFILFSIPVDRAVLLFEDDENLKFQLESYFPSLSAALNLLESIASRYLPDEPGKLPDGIPQLGPITAHEGFLRAVRLAKELADDNKLIYLANVDLHKFRDVIGPGIDYTGRLKQNGAWLFLFRSDKDQTELKVTSTDRVRSCGMTITALLYKFYLLKNHGGLNARRSAARSSRTARPPSLP